MKFSQILKLSSIKSVLSYGLPKSVNTSTYTIDKNDRVFKNTLTYGDGLKTEEISLQWLADTEGKPMSFGWAVIHPLYLKRTTQGWFFVGKKIKCGETQTGLFQWDDRESCWVIRNDITISSLMNLL